MKLRDKAEEWIAKAICLGCAKRVHVRRDLHHYAAIAAAVRNHRRRMARLAKRAKGG